MKRKLASRRGVLACGGGRGPTVVVVTKVRSRSAAAGLVALLSLLPTAAPAQERAARAGQPRQAITRPAAPPRACPDPAVQRLEFRIASRDSQLEGRVRISAVVGNDRAARYLSSPDQQRVVLFEDGEIVAEQGFGSLEPGQRVRLDYERPWRAGSRAEGESPPEYRALIEYAPGVRRDGNRSNDDCNLDNNHRARSGADINLMFRAPPSFLPPGVRVR